MKFTQKQTELINEYKRLEKEYGEGNVFLRYINDFWKIRFIIHSSGQTEYKPIYDYRINGKIINGLQKNKMLVGYDTEHKEADPNNYTNYKEGVYFLGSRIILEK